MADIMNYVGYIKFMYKIYHEIMNGNDDSIPHEELVTIFIGDNIDDIDKVKLANNTKIYYSIRNHPIEIKLKTPKKRPVEQIKRFPICSIGGKAPVLNKKQNKNKNKNKNKNNEMDGGVTITPSKIKIAFKNKPIKNTWKILGNFSEKMENFEPIPSDYNVMFGKFVKFIGKTKGNNYDNVAKAFDNIQMKIYGLRLHMYYLYESSSEINDLIRNLFEKIYKNLAVADDDRIKIIINTMILETNNVDLAGLQCIPRETDLIPDELSVNEIIDLFTDLVSSVYTTVHNNMSTTKLIDIKNGDIASYFDFLKTKIMANMNDFDQIQKLFNNIDSFLIPVYNYIETNATIKKPYLDENVDFVFRNILKYDDDKKIKEREEFKILFGNLIVLLRNEISNISEDLNNEDLENRGFECIKAYDRMLEYYDVFFSPRDTYEGYDHEVYDYDPTEEDAVVFYQLDSMADSIQLILRKCIEVSTDYGQAIKLIKKINIERNVGDVSNINTTFIRTNNEYNRILKSLEVGETNNNQSVYNTPANKTTFPSDLNKYINTEIYIKNFNFVYFNTAEINTLSILSKERLRYVYLLLDYYVKIERIISICKTIQGLSDIEGLSDKATFISMLITDDDTNISDFIVSIWNQIKIIIENGADEIKETNRIYIYRNFIEFMYLLKQTTALKTDTTIKYPFSTHNSFFKTEDANVQLDALASSEDLYNCILTIVPKVGAWAGGIRGTKKYIKTPYKCRDGKYRKAFRIKGEGNTIFVTCNKRIQKASEIVLSKKVKKQK